MVNVILYEDVMAIKVEHDGADRFEFIIRFGVDITMDEVWEQHKRAMDLGFSDGKIPETGEGEKLQDGTGT